MNVPPVLRSARRNAGHVLAHLVRVLSTLARALPVGPRFVVRTARRVRRDVAKAITNLLLGAAGTNRSVLRRAERDKVKQVSLGGTLLTTAGLAAVAATIALQTAFDLPWAFAALGGLVWGVAILNLDRWLVVSTGRQHWFPTLMMALPRIGLALIIGAVVSTPLTLQAFKSEIDAELVRLHQQEQQQFEQRLLDDERYAAIPAQQARILELEQRLSSPVPPDAATNDPEVQAARARLVAVEAEYAQAEKDVECEKEGTCGSGRAGAGPASAEKTARRDRLATERADLQAEVDRLVARAETAAVEAAASQSEFDRTELADLREEVAASLAQRAADVAAHDAAVGSDDGLLARLEALDSLTHDNEALHRAHLALFLFLTAIEILPILFKTLMAFSKETLYDEIMRKDDERARFRETARQVAEEEELSLAHELGIEATRAHEEKRRDAEVQAAEIVLGAQMTMTREAVAEWKRRQREAIRLGMEDFVKEHPVQPVGGGWQVDEAGTAERVSARPRMPRPRAGEPTSRLPDARM